MKCNEFEKIIIDYIDGKLENSLKIEADKHVADCSECHTLLIQEKNIQHTLKNLPQYECPGKVIENVFQKIREQKSPVFPVIKRITWFNQKRSLKIAIAAVAVTVLLIFTFLNPVNKNQNIDNVQYSEKEIEQAKKDIELALAYLNHYTQKTQLILEKQVFSQPIIKPVKSSVKKAFKPLLDGGAL